MVKVDGSGCVPAATRLSKLGTAGEKVTMSRVGVGVGTGLGVTLGANVGVGEDEGANVGVGVEGRGVILGVEVGVMVGSAAGVGKSWPDPDELHPAAMIAISVRAALLHANGPSHRKYQLISNAHFPFSI